MGRRPQITSAKLAKMTPSSILGLGIFLLIFGILAFIVVSSTDLFGGLVIYFYLLIFPDIIFGIYLIFSSISKIIEQKEYAKKLSKSNISQIDNMSGIEFEIYLKTLFIKLGYSALTTKKSGDFGADLILYKNGNKIIVQAKRYNKHVGVQAVQESYSAKSYYNANESWVVTNNYFTRQAYELSFKNGVKLIDRDKLVDLILKIK